MITIKHLPLADYQQTWDAMRAHCDNRSGDAADEIWLLEHSPVYTLGQAGRREHLLRDRGIPVIQSDRGGQITYHGPGQLIAYLLLDIRRRKLTPRQLVRRAENAVVALLNDYDIVANGDEKAPGVYVGGRKIAALGLRIRRGCVYHGLSLNVNMDLSPFADINPCGYANLPITQLADLVAPPPTMQTIKDKLIAHLQQTLAAA